MTFIIGNMEKRKEGKSLIKWMPHGRNIVVVDDEENNKEKKRLASIGLVDPDTLSDKERMDLGFTSKAADVANRSSEDQLVYEIVAIGSEVSDVSVGDKVMFRAGCQGTSIKVEGKFYMQLGEFEVLGKFLD